MSETLFGKYRLLAELGRGGMADVYLASSSGMGGFQKLVVIKVSRVSDDPAFSQMFLDEARLSARLSHSNVVQTYEVGEDNGRQFIVMEYLDGPSLFRLNRLAGPHGGVPLRTTVQLLSQVLSGLQYAHTLKDFDGTLLNVVHRDLSPQNLMVTTQGVCKLLDFGIAKSSESRTQTHAGFYRGKLNYMAPEQALGNAVDARADVFSIGVLLAEAITRKPFWGEATTAVISSRLVTGDIPDIEKAGVEPILEEICKQALTHDREQRLAGAREFKDALEWYLGTTGGPISHEEIAAFIAPLIAADRQKVDALIDQQLRKGAAPVPMNVPLPQMKGMTAGSYAAVTGNPNVPTTNRGTGYTPMSSVASVAAAGALAPVAVAEPTARPPIDRGVKTAARKPDAATSQTRLIIGLVAGGFAVLVGLVVWLATRSPSVVTVPQVAQAAAAPAPPVPAPPRVQRVQVNVEPAGARLELEGVEVSNPYVTPQVDGRRHRLTASAAGHEVMVREVAFEGDLSLSLVLKPLPEAPPIEPAVIEEPAPPAARGTATPTPTRRPPPSRAAAKAVVREETKAPIEIQEMPAKAKPTPGKRSLDTEVFEENKKELDRSNPWEN